MTNRNVGTRRVSRKQLDILWEYLHAHRDIAVSYNRSLQAKEYSKRKWQNIADVLNAQGDGAHKDWKSWSKYWVDYKAKMKKRVAALRSSQQRTGGGPSIEQPLSDIENKFLQILGNDYGQGLSGVQVEPFPPSVSTIPEMEIESPVIDFQVLDPNITNSETSESILRGPPNPIQTLVQEPTCHPPDEPSSSRSPPPCLPTPTAAVLSPRRRRRRREVPISHEVARRALVQSSESRAQAALHSNQTLQAINHTLIEIKDAIKELCSIHQRIERADGKPPVLVSKIEYDDESLPLKDDKKSS